MENNKLKEMLIGYAAAHQHPFNVFIHMIGIPVIMLGVLIPMTWLAFDLGFIELRLSHLLIAAFFGFYLTLDVGFAAVFLIGGLLLEALAVRLGMLPLATSGTIAALAFAGGYAAQFIGHYVERSMPVLVKHPIQAQLAAPFFTVVELFKIVGLRQELFNEVQAAIRERRNSEATA